MSASLLEELKLDAWNPVLTAASQAAAIDALEAGHILYLPRLGFALMPHEHRFLSSEWSDGDSKNINLRGGERRLRGARGGEDDLALMQAMMERFSGHCRTLIGALLARGRAVCGHGGQVPAACTPRVAGRGPPAARPARDQAKPQWV